MAAQLTDLGNRLDALNVAGSKGVHADVTGAEADQCIIQTYLLIGDFLRLAESASPAVRP